MKRVLVTVGLSALIVSPSFAGPEMLIKERAKELSNQNNVRQGVAPPTQGGAPGNTEATVAPLSVSLTRFQTTLAGIQAGSDVSAAQKQQMTQDLLAGAGGAKPSSTAAAKLAQDLAAACAQKPLPEASRSRLVRELDAVLNPGKYPQAKLEGIFTDVQAIFQANGLNRNQAVVIADDVRALSAEVQKGGAH